MEGYIGTILLFAGTYAPANWMFCSGQQIPISQNAVLFSILGTSFGCDGVSYFNLPDFRGRVPISAGQGPGSAYNYQLGNVAGVESVTLSTQQMPTHNHTANASASGQDTAIASGNFLGSGKGATIAIYQDDLNSQATLGSATIGNQGNSQPHENRQPLLAVNFIICVAGIYPTRP